MNLRQLMGRADIWRAGEMPSGAVMTSAIDALDAVLPGGGWPTSGITELLCAHGGTGGLRLVLPALAALSRAGRWITWVNPPYVPYAPALSAQGFDLSRILIVELPGPSALPREDELWAFEQALRFDDCGAALLWLNDAELLTLRRLQLAAETGSTWGVVFRPARAGRVSSPARLRLSLEERVQAGTADTGIELQVLKGRGAQAGRRHWLEPVDLSCPDVICERPV